MTAAPVLARSLKYSLQISQGENLGQVYQFNKPVVTIGRGPQNDLILVHDPKVSRIHAEIRIEAGFLKISNMSDKNFILINGEKIEHKYIQQSSVLQIGDTVFQVKIDVAHPTAAIAAPAAPVLAKAQTPMKPVATATASSYQQPAPKQFKPNSQADNSRLRFYIIIVVIGAAVAWFVLDKNAKRKAEIGLRTEGDIVRAIEESTVAVKELKRQQDSSGQNTIQYKSAQEHYIKGFRDYRQRQYARAMQSFQAALSFYPAHELARKYLVQAQRKFEESVDANMSLGRKYYQRQNYKLCQSSFANVMIMLKDSSKPKYREAKQLYDECSLRLEGRF
jgi:pSer/pThr/pTyr-binding forkhead associated (FHA) protein